MSDSRVAARAPGASGRSRARIAGREFSPVPRRRRAPGRSNDKEGVVEAAVAISLRSTPSGTSGRPPADAPAGRRSGRSGWPRARGRGLGGRRRREVDAAHSRRRDDGRPVGLARRAAVPVPGQLGTWPCGRCGEGSAGVAEAGSARRRPLPGVDRQLHDAVPGGCDAPGAALGAAHRHQDQVRPGGRRPGVRHEHPHGRDAGRLA